MHIRLIAVGDRQPGWVDDAFALYRERYPPAWKFRLDTIPTASRSRNSKASGPIDAEGDKILQKLKRAERLIALDERGQQFTTAELSGQLQEWQADGRDLSFVIGGPDGLSSGCLERAETRWSLSKLTLPHGLARVLFAEQLYRAWSITEGHPYHRP